MQKGSIGAILKKEVYTALWHSSFGMTIKTKNIIKQ